MLIRFLVAASGFTLSIMSIAYANSALTDYYSKQNQEQTSIEIDVNQ